MLKADGAAWLILLLTFVMGRVVQILLRGLFEVCCSKGGHSLCQRAPNAIQISNGVSQFRSDDISSVFDSKCSKNELLEHTPDHMDHNMNDICTICKIRKIRKIRSVVSRVRTNARMNNMIHSSINHYKNTWWWSLAAR